MIFNLIHWVYRGLPRREEVRCMKLVDKVAFWLVVIGAINWGLTGLFNFNLVSTLFGGVGLETVVYGLVGVSGVYVGAMALGGKK